MNTISLKQYRESLMECMSDKIGDLDDFDKEYLCYASIALHMGHYQTKERIEFELNIVQKNMYFPEQQERFKKDKKLLHDSIIKIITRFYEKGDKLLKINM